MRHTPVLLPAVPVLFTLALFASGCSKDGSSRETLHGARSLGASSLLAPSAAGGAAPALAAERVKPPPSTSGLVTYTEGSRSVDFWPYTSSTLEDQPSDPISLIFTGAADPGRIRAALFALDGNRAAFGFPNAPPFNQRWQDAIGDVQTTFIEDGDGWTGSVIQLALGDYAPVRVHLRLFRIGSVDGESWTLGAAHFEVLIPGTPEHQVLSWNLARDVVVADFARAGLLLAPPAPTGVITASPFREIPPVIYNGLPPELKGIVGGPLGEVTSPVPIPSDGRAVALRLAPTPVPPAGTWAQQFSLPFSQLIPKPLCSDGPYDWVLVQGTVDFQKSASVDGTGRYTYQLQVSGFVTVTPVDVTQSPPAPSGAPYQARVSDTQQGSLGDASNVSAYSKRIAPQPGGAELLLTDLKVLSEGIKSYRLQTQCLAP